MANAKFTFPRGFLWGTATAAHQVEGGNTNNNWSLWEEEGRIQAGHSASVACDWWKGRWREDFDRAAEAGQNAHRMSIEWSRVQPAPDRWDEAALDHYRDMVRGLRERGLKPVITLHHFTDPRWVMERGGWEMDISHLFEAYVEKVVTALKEYADTWVTINEPNVYASVGYLLGEFPPGKESMLAALKVMGNLVRGHAAAYHAIHRLQPAARVGMAVNYRGMSPHRKWFLPDRWIARLQSRQYNEFFVEAAHSGWLRFPIGRRRFRQAAGTQDFLGINYYTRDHVKFAPLAHKEAFGKRVYPDNLLMSETGFIAHDPEGLFEALKWGSRYQLPMLVSENGVEDSDDRLRPRYLAEHIHQLWRAVNFNWRIEGYFHWTLVDNFEWERGWTQRFGLWELDLETQARRKRPSADFYAEICQANALSSEMVARFAPESFKAMFPND
jgi:beta-glucosidase